MTSDDPTVWDDPVGLQRPAEPWDLIQLGNCGSPIESPAGWIMLTHGVGPMRRYAIGAELLDLDDPTRVIGHLREPLLTPAEDERDGYVPNVVYSCGAMLHGDTIVLPYGMSDANVGVATIPLRELARPVDLTRGRGWVFSGQGRKGLERLEPTSAGRDRRQRAVRLAVHAPPDGNRLSVEKVLPVALAHRRIRHLPKGDARRALTRMNPSPVRRERRGVRGQPAARGTAGAGNLRRSSDRPSAPADGQRHQVRHHGPPRLVRAPPLSEPPHPRRFGPPNLRPRAVTDRVSAASLQPRAPRFPGGSSWVEGGDARAMVPPGGHLLPRRRHLSRTPTATASATSRVSSTVWTTWPGSASPASG